MKNLVNFAHPLSAEVLAEIETKVGDSVKEIYRPAQFDLFKSLDHQVDDLVAGIIEDADLVIPPSLSAAATLLSDHFLSDRRPFIVWLRRTESFPPKFELGGIE